MLASEGCSLWEKEYHHEDEDEDEEDKDDGP